MQPKNTPPGNSQEGNFRLDSFDHPTLFYSPWGCLIATGCTVRMDCTVCTSSLAALVSSGFLLVICRFANFQFSKEILFSDQSRRTVVALIARNPNYHW